MQRHTLDNQPEDSRRHSRNGIRSRRSDSATRRIWLSGGAAATVTSIRAWARLQSTTRIGRLTGATIILLVLAGTCLCLAGAGRTQAGHIQHPVRLAQEKTGAFAGNLPAQGHWVDTNDGTTYLVQFTPNPKGFSTFDFTTLKGQQ